MPEQPKASVTGRRGFLLKRDSLQKIKCSAVYPLQLAGHKLNRDALKQLFETLIIKARTLSQKALLVLMLVTLKFVGAVILIWVKVPAKNPSDDVCDKKKKVEALLSFHERLVSKAQKLQRHTKTKTDMKQFEINFAQNQKVQQEIPNECEITATSTSALTVQPITKGEEIKAAKATLTHTVQQKLFKICVYCGALFAYLQLFILTVALNTASIPPGLVFMISSLLLIAFIVFKVFFKEQNKMKEARKLQKFSRQSSNSDDENYNKPKETDPTKRQSRTRHRSLTIDWETMRLSKVKLL